MEKQQISFSKQSYPEIIIYETYFEIKAIDYWEFRKFLFKDVKEIGIKKTKESLWYKFLLITSYTARMFANQEPNYLVISLNNGGSWEYKTNSKRCLEFSNVVEIIKNKSISEN